MKQNKNITIKLKEALLENILSVPGVANIYKSTGINGIEINKNDIGWVINIICFFDNNVWNIVNQVQKNLWYIAEKINKNQGYIILNIIVHDLVEE